MTHSETYFAPEEAATSVSKTISPSPRSTALLVAYLVHMILPLALLLDCLATWRLGWAQISEKIVFSISAAWLITTIGALLLARDRARFLQRTRGPLTSFFTLCITLAIFEVGLRVTLGKDVPTLWTPGQGKTYTMDTKVMPDVSPIVDFHVNRVGLRGPEMPTEAHVYKIVAIGGSTTECLALTDTKTWPQLLMDEMNRRQRDRSVWVGNAGVSGHTAVHHLVLLQNLPLLAKVDALVFLIGINDLQATLVQRGGSSDAYIWKDAGPFRGRLAGDSEYGYPRFRHLYMFRIARRATLGLAFLARYRFHEEENWIEVDLRRKRALSPVMPLPDLTVALNEYRVRLQKITEECKARRIRCVFLTQPSMWRPDLPPEDERLLMFGWFGRKGSLDGHISTADAQRAMNAYNRVMLDVCRESGIECHDLASIVPKDTSALYDDVHFNENGAAIVARAVADYLLTRPPFQ